MASHNDLEALRYSSVNALGVERLVGSFSLTVTVLEGVLWGIVKIMVPFGVP